MKVRIKKILQPPIVQIALDMPSVSFLRAILRQIPISDRIIVEAGTALIKKYGVKIIRLIRRELGDVFVVADLKTQDVGRIEAHLAYEETADGAVVSGTAPRHTIEEFLRESNNLQMWGIVDMLNVYDPLKVLGSLCVLPDIIVLHRGIDEEQQKTLSLPLINKIKKKFGAHLLVAVAGGVNLESAREALSAGADILIVGRYITASKEPRKAINEFLSLIRR
jgi:bifunctional enzyme Fae/Hps